MLTICPGYDHRAGPGKLIYRPCNVKFNIYLPKDVYRFQCYFLVARAQHTHHPPPANRLPTYVRHILQEAFQKIRALDVKPSKLGIYCSYG